MGKSLREKMREQMSRRVQESYDSRESSGRGELYFNRDKTQGVPFWKCEASSEEHVIDIIPYCVGDNDPKLSKGEVNYLLDIWVHRGIGANESTYICPARNYNKPCPICDHIKELKRDGEYDEELVKSLYPKRRTIYNILCYDSEKEERRGIQIWEVAHWFIERHIAPLARAPKSGGFIPFADATMGKSIAFTKQAKTEFIGHKLVDRDYEITDEILEQAYCLDELIDVLPYDELYKIYHGKSDTETFEEGVGTDKGQKQEESMPQRTLRNRGRRAQKESDASNTSQAVECPGGGVFGQDTDVFDACATCSVWDNCAMLYDTQHKADDVPF